MAGKPPEPPPSTVSKTAGSAPSGGLGKADERTGPVAVSRLRKADGRSLILYSTGRERA